MQQNTVTTRRVPRLVRAAVLFLVTLSLLLFVGAVAAATVLDTVDLGPFRVDLLDVSDDLTTWVYAVTVPSGTTVQYALSHTSLGIDPACLLVEPTDNDIYTTGVSVETPNYMDVCDEFGYDCVAEQYHVEAPATEPTYGSVIKFETYDDEGLKEAGQTHIFVITLEGVTGYKPGGMYFSVTYATDLAAGTIMGPICSPTAVTLTALRASPGAGIAFGLIASLVVAAGVVVGSRKLR